MVTPVGDKDVMKIYEWLRKSFKVNPLVDKKKDVDRKIYSMVKKLEKKRPSKAVRLKIFRRGIWKKGVWTRIKEHVKLHKVKSHTRKAKPIKSYVRTYSKWSSDEKNYVKRYKHLKVSTVKIMLEKKFNKGYTYSSVATMKSRV